MLSTAKEKQLKPRCAQRLRMGGDSLWLEISPRRSLPSLIGPGLLVSAVA